MLKSKLIIKITTIFVIAILLVGCSTKKTDNQKLSTIDFILDWVPNTNHTGLYVAQKLGYDKELGFSLNIKRPPEGSTTELIASGKDAAFGISFQDTLAKKFEKDDRIQVIATIINNNTSGIISKKSLNINSPADMSNHSYGTWDDPIEKSIINKIMQNENKNIDDVKLVPNTADNSVIGIENNMFDTAWVYYAWDVILAQHMKVDNNFFFIKDYANELNFYSPVIIANKEFISKNEELTKKVMTAIKKGYIYAIDHPKEAAEILIENAPELADKKEFVIKSQEWLAKEYAASKENWGIIDKNRWDNFYNYLYENKLINVDLTKKELFTNKYIGE